MVMASEIVKAKKKYYLANTLMYLICCGVKKIQFGHEPHPLNIKWSTPDIKQVQYRVNIVECL